MSETPTIFAIDFGTSNSLLAAASATRIFPPAPLDPAAGDPTVLRSALYFTTLERAVFGSTALREFVASGFRGRLMRSIKRHLPSPAFTATRIGDKLVTLEELVGRFLAVMRERACAHFGTDVRRVVLGRPARFSNDPGADALAETRLWRAAELAGFEAVSFCPEPVAAAYDFASDLTEPRVVLVADLGGGTSDYTLVRMRQGSFGTEDVLAVGGVAVAGDALDGALVRRSVAPELGSTVEYRVPFGHNLLPMPAELVELLCSPADLTVADRVRELRLIGDIRAGAVRPGDARERLEKFAAIVDDGVGFALYEAVEATKRRLSEHERSRLVFDYPGAELDLEVERAELEAASEKPLARMLAALDETLRAGGVEPNQVEIVCLTGGTSSIPLIERALRERLPNAELRRLRSFHSVVQGLARRAQELAAQS